jgi:phosphatidylglycerophosphate synthase
MANLITVARTLLAFLAVAMLRWHTWEIYVGAALLTLLLIWMDAWDGWVALACVYGTVALCVVRGVPVLVEARRFFAPERAD